MIGQSANPSLKNLRILMKSACGSARGRVNTFQLFSKRLIMPLEEALGKTKNVNQNPIYRETNVSSLTKSLGGELSIECNETKGLKIIITLPEADSENVTGLKKEKKLDRNPKLFMV